MAFARSAGLSSSARLLTEAVGTFVFLSTLALAYNAGNLAAAVGGVALVAMVFMGAYVSGAHYNPAISLGVFLRGHLSLVHLLGYWLAQFAAGIAAFCFGYVLSGHAAAIAPGATVTNGQAIGAEILFSAALVLVALNVTVTDQTGGNSFYGLAIGLTFVAGAYVAGPISGGALNPAIGLGATVVAVVFAHGSWSHLWLYIVGPLAGGCVAAVIHAVQAAGAERARAVHAPGQSEDLAAHEPIVTPPASVTLPDAR